MLKRELGLDDEDIIDLPILFKLVEDEKEYRAVAYYPDMVNFTLYFIRYQNLLLVEKRCK